MAQATRQDWVPVVPAVESYTLSLTPDEADTLSAMFTKHVAPGHMIQATKADVTPLDFPKPGESMDMDWDTGRRRKS
jgi:hypothetical protein